MVAAQPDPVTRFAPVTLTGVIPAASGPPDRAPEELVTAIDTATRALITAMRAHGVAGGVQTELEWRAEKIVAAACETGPSQCVVLTKGSQRDVQRLADAGAREVHGPTANTVPADLEQAGRLIDRMVTDRG